MKVKSESEVAQSYPTLSDPMDGSPSGSAIPGILQARVLAWGAIAFILRTIRKKVLLLLIVFFILFVNPEYYFIHFWVFTSTGFFSLIYQKTS